VVYVSYRVVRHGWGVYTLVVRTVHRRCRMAQTFEERLAARKALLDKHGVSVNIRGPRQPRSVEQQLQDQIGGYKGLLADLNRDFSPEQVEKYVSILNGLEARLEKLLASKASTTPTA
jgi:hypothetical protein